MKFYDCGATILITFLIVSALVAFSIEFLGNDNPIEQLTEEAIRLETGKVIDLTPERSNAL